MSYLKNKNSKYIFFIGLLLAILVTIGTFVVNFAGAWYGGPANAGELVMTLVYIAFWCVFSIISLKYSSLMKITFVMGALTFFSAVVGFLCVLTNSGFIIEALLSVFASVPFYGLRFFINIDWMATYGIVSIVSLLWLIFAGVNLRRSR